MKNLIVALTTSLALACLGLLAGCHASPAAAAARVAHAPGTPGSERVPTATTADIDSLMDVVSQAAPFRRDRRPTEHPYLAATPNQAIPGSPPPSVPRPAKPVLRITGYVGGRAPQVIVDGLPGLEAPRALAVGDTVAGIRLRAVNRAGVRLSGLDTSWLLPLPRAP